MTNSPGKPFSRSRNQIRWTGLNVADTPVNVVLTSEIQPGLSPIGQQDRAKKARNYLAKLMDDFPTDLGIYETLVTTDEFDTAVANTIVTNKGGRTPFFARHQMHTAVNPELSPFVMEKPTATNLLTIEVVRRPADLLVTRLYAGEEILPLPWQASARKIGLAACREFWLDMAYIAAPEMLIANTITVEEPDWYADMQWSAPTVG